MEHYADLPSAITDLRKKGYTLDFNTAVHSLACSQDGCVLKPDEFEIDNVFRFEGDSDPENQSILYAISSGGGRKGLLINSFGVYADTLTDDLIKKLSVHHKL